MLQSSSKLVAQRQEALDACVRDVAELREACQSALEERRDLSDVIVASQRKLAEAGPEKESQLAQWASAQAQIQQLTEELEEIQAAVRKAGREKEVQVAAVACEAEVLRGLESARTRVAQRHTELCQEVQQCTGEVDHLEKASRDTQAEKEAAAAVLADAQRELREAEEERVLAGHSRAQLQAEMDQGATKTAAVRAAISAARAERDGLAQGMACAKEELLDLQQVRVEVAAQVQRCTDLANQARRAFVVPQEERNESVVSLERLSAELSDLRSEKAALTGRHRSVGLEKARYRRHTADARKAMDHIASESTKLETSLEPLRAELQVAEDQRAALRGEKLDLEAKIAAAAQAAPAAKAALRQVEEERQDLCEALAQEREELNGASASRTAVVAEGAEMRVEASRVSREADALQETVSCMATKLTQAAAELEIMTGRLRAADAQRQAASGEQEQLRVDLEQATVRARQAGVAAAAADVTALRAKLDSTQGRHHAATEELSTKRTQLETCTGKVTTLRGEVAGLESQRQFLLGAADALLQDLDAAAQERRQMGTLQVALGGIRLASPSGSGLATPSRVDARAQLEALRRELTTKFGEEAGASTSTPTPSAGSGIDKIGASLASISTFSGGALSDSSSLDTGCRAIGG